MSELRSNEEAWAKLADEATPGPWVLDSHAHGTGGCRCLSCSQTSTVWQPGGRFCDDVPRDENDIYDEGDRCDQFGYTYEDAAFVAAAREAVPALLAEVTRLRTELAAEKERADTNWENDHKWRAGLEHDLDAARAEVSQLRAEVAVLRKMALSKVPKLRLESFHQFDPYERKDRPVGVFCKRCGNTEGNVYHDIQLGAALAEPSGTPDGQGASP